MASANISQKTRYGVYKRDGFQCALCGCHDGLQIHHAIPRGKGGGNTVENLITLCDKCHAQAHGIDCYPGVVDQRDVQHACVEYLADMYTTVERDGTTKTWDPYA